MLISLRARILLGIAAPAVLVLVLSCVVIYVWVRAERHAHLDLSLETRAAAMAALVDLDGGVWDVEFDRAELPVVELFGTLSAYEVRVAASGGVIAQRRLDGLDLPFPTESLPDLTPPALAALPRDRPLELLGTSRTLTLADGRQLRTWNAVYLVRAHDGEPGDGGRVPVGGPPGSAPVVSVVVAQDLAPLHEELRTLLMIQLVVGALFSGFSLLSGWLLSQHIVAPIERIADRAARVRTPSAEPPLPLSGNGDEIDRLVEALNQSYLRLNAAYELQARFTADASHELRTPLAVIRSHAELALRRTRSAEEYEAVLAAIVTASARMEAVVEGLLVLARADASGRDGRSEREIVDLSALAQELVDERGPADLPPVRVEAPAPVFVMADVFQLERLLQNLLSNAIRHTPATGRVTLHVRTDGASAILEVHDTGEGIPAHALPHIFERFFSADEARSRVRGGAGLGLSIVEAVVRHHGGRVEVESELGVGTRLRVILPSSPAPTAPALVRNGEVLT